MKIAILAYGSLIWDEEVLAPHITGGWRRGGGPALPVEFCRVSPKRKGALVLAIDEQAGHAVPTAFTTSRRQQLRQAIADLAARERCAEDHIAFARRDGAHGQCSARIASAVNAWLRTSGHEAAIWAALPPNFEQEAGQLFSHAAGLEWLQSLRGESLAEAWRYITFAPEETDTPFRRFLSANTWWRNLSFA